jgi:hypothetical protein
MPVTLAQVRPRYVEPKPFLTKLFWAYFLLLIFEGALRKWIFPPLSAPLLLVRDPIGVMIIFEAYRENKWPEKWSAITGILSAAVLGICVIQLVAGDNTWFAGLYGLRSYLLPFPVAFIMGENLDEQELRKFGYWTMMILLPMTLLEIAQYLAPTGSFLNKGAYEGGSQIMYTEAHVRASGTFSFVTGTYSFGPLAAAFILYGFVNEKLAPRWLLWASGFALLLSVPIIGSRTLVYELAGIGICAAIGALCGVTQLFQSLKFAFPFLAIAFLVSLLPLFSEASNSLNARFRQASNSEGSLTNAVEERTFGSMFYTIEHTDFASNPLGHGMGVGAAAVTKLTLGDVAFVAGEGEFDRLVYELGPFPGLLFMAFCLLMAAFVATAAVAQARRHEPLALLLVPLLTTSLMSVLEQPTEQGFMVVSVAFSLAALKRPQEAPVRRPQIPVIRFSGARRTQSAGLPRPASRNGHPGQGLLRPF